MMETRRCHFVAPGTKWTSRHIPNGGLRTSLCPQHEARRPRVEETPHAGPFCACPQ
jgi:hypothetical protein